MKRRFKIISLGVLAIFIVTAGFSCKGVSCTKRAAMKPVTLEYWGVWDSPSQVSLIINAYSKTRGTVKINYKQFRYDEYERKLLEAWADDRGPDIFAIPVTWLKAYKHRIEPMPSKTAVPVQEVKQGIREEVITTIQELRGLALRDVRNLFVDVVYDDIVLEDEIYGLPYYLDTLVTFYNSDLLTNAGIPQPASDFHDLVEQSQKLTRATEDSRVIQSAVALGGTDNIPRFFDIFSSLMIQNGVEVKGKHFNPGKDPQSRDRLNQVFGFYTDFARPGRASFSWDNKLDQAPDLFAAGRLAYFFGYSYHADDLRSRDLPFSWGIVNFPQTRGAEGTKYYGDYWVNVVAKKSANKDAAWNFIQTTATNPKYIEEYLTKSKKPTALRALIESQMNNDDLIVFTSQVLTADNWYNGYDIDLAERYTGEIIDAINAGEMIIDQQGETISLFIDRINQTYIQLDEY